MIDFESIKNEIKQKTQHFHVEKSIFLKSNCDCYGNFLETEISEIFVSVEDLKKQTKNLSKTFKADGFYGEIDNRITNSGAIPDIIDFTFVVAFACAADGSPFCIDFRNDNKECIIWWDSDYWRRVADSIDDFLGLIKS